MSDEQETGGVRRFGRRDRKRSLDPREPLFPPDEPTSETDQTEDIIKTPTAEVDASEPAAPLPPAQTRPNVVQPAPAQSRAVHQGRLAPRC